MSTANLTPAELSANHSVRLTVAIGFAIALPIIAVALRIYARKLNRLKLGPDDYMIILGAVLTVGNTGGAFLANKGGNGRHEETLSKAELRDYSLALYINEQTFGVAVAVVKFAVLLLYRRIFITRGFRISTTIVAVLITLWVIVKGLVGAFQCTPVRKAWLKSKPGHCLNFIDIVLYSQAFNVVFDITLLILPMNAVYKLHLPLYKRLGVMSIFAVGTFTVVVAIIRIGVIAAEVLEYGPTLPDVTWYTSKWTWTVIDPAVGCFVACMPTWAPLIKPLSHIHEYAGRMLRTIFNRSTFMRASNPSRNATKLPEQVDEEQGSFYLANYKQPESRRVAVGSGSINAQQDDLDPVLGSVMVRTEFTQKEHMRFAC